MRLKAFCFGFFVFLFFVGFVSAEHVVSFSPNQVNVGELTDFSFTLENLNDTSPITQVSVGIVNGCTYESESESTSASPYTFEDQGVAISWMDSFLVNGSETKTFSFSMTCNEPGDGYGISVSSLSDQGTFAGIIPFEVNEVVDADPVASFGTNPEDELLTAVEEITFEFSCEDDSAVDLIELWTNVSGKWKADLSWTNYTSGEKAEQKMDVDDGNYVWGVYCEDDSGNSDWTQNRTFEIESGWDPDEGAQASIGIVYVVLDKDFKKGYKKKLNLGDQLKFSIGEEYHTMKFLEIRDNKTTVEVKSDVQRIGISVGESIMFEVTGDSYYDLSVTLNSLDYENKTAEFTVKEVNETVGEGEQVGNSGEENNESGNENLDENNSEQNLGSNQEEGQSENSETNSATMKYIVLFISLFVLIGGGVLFYKYSKNQKAQDQRVDLVNSENKFSEE